jgi:hypothetical protein
MTNGERSKSQQEQEHRTPNAATVVDRRYKDQTSNGTNGNDGTRGVEDEDEKTTLRQRSGSDESRSASTVGAMEHPNPKSIEVEDENAKVENNAPKVRKTAVYRQCKCFCTECNSKTGVTIEEAGATSISTASHIDIRGCLCFCERCHEAEKELWRRRYNRGMTNDECRKHGMRNRAEAEMQN